MSTYIDQEIEGMFQSDVTKKNTIGTELGKYERTFLTFNATLCIQEIVSSLQLLPRNDSTHLIFSLT